MSCCKSRNIVEVIKQNHKTAHVRGICLMTPNNESFDWFNTIISIIYIISQQLIVQCNVCMQCVIYISNKSQYLKNEERYVKTIDGVPLSL